MLQLTNRISATQPERQPDSHPTPPTRAPPQFSLKKLGLVLGGLGLDSHDFVRFYWFQKGPDIYSWRFGTSGWWFPFSKHRKTLMFMISGPDEIFAPHFWSLGPSISPSPHPSPAPLCDFLLDISPAPFFKTNEILKWKNNRATCSTKLQLYVHFSQPTWQEPCKMN